METGGSLILTDPKQTMTINNRKIFLASSSELKEDRKEFEIFISRKNNDWVNEGVHLELVLWEDFLDAMSQTRLQDEYNKRIRQCDLFVMLFFTKVGKYTAEEFETAFGQFKATNKPFIFTYFKDADINTGNLNLDDLISLKSFQKKLDDSGHFYTRYKNIDELKLHFSQQLDKLAANGFIELQLDKGGINASGGNHYQATLTGYGAIAQGPGATAVGAGGFVIKGNHTGDINTGTQVRGDLVRGDKVLGDKIGHQINTGGSAYVGGNVHAGRDFIGRDKITHAVSPTDLGPVFASFLEQVLQQTPAGQRFAAEQKANELKAEIGKGQQADDSRLGKIIDGLIGLVPGAASAVVSLFATPILSDIAGPVTKFVLEKLQVR